MKWIVGILLLVGVVFLGVWSFGKYIMQQTSKKCGYAAGLN